MPVSGSGRSSGTMHTRPVARAAGRPGCRPRSRPGSLEFGSRCLSTFDACRGTAAQAMKMEAPASRRPSWRTPPGRPAGAALRCVRLLPTRLRQASEQAARIAGSPITAGGHANGGAVHHERRRDHAQPRGQPTVVPRRTPTWRGRVAPSKMSANPVRAVRRLQLPCSERRPGRRRGRARRPALDPSQGEEPAPGQHPAAGRVLQVDVDAVVRATATVGSLADRTVLDLLGCRRIGAYRGRTTSAGSVRRVG